MVGILDHNGDAVCESCGKAFIDHPGIVGTCAENVRLHDIIRRARLEFCKEGSDGAICAAMFTILREATTPQS